MVAANGSLFALAKAMAACFRLHHDRRGHVIRPWDYISQLTHSMQKRRERVTKLRGDADLARDEGRWHDAAAAYVGYLSLRPRDFARWVQLGHTAKEASDLAMASSAYQRALKLKPRDADLLINMGHLAKMRDDRPGAAEFYARSFGIDGNANARYELAAPALRLHLSPHHVALLEREERKRTAAFQGFAHGLRVVSVENLALATDGRLDLFSADSWIEFEIDAVGSSQIGLMEIDLGPDREAFAALKGRLYVDYGRGFNEPDSIALRPEPRNAITLALPSRIRRLRWDPDEQAGQISFSAAHFRLLHDAEEIEALVADEADEREITTAQSLIRRLLAPEDFPTSNPMALNRIFAPRRFDRGFDYDHWRQIYTTPVAKDYARIRTMTEGMARKPTFSFVIPTYNTPPGLLRDCIDCLLSQTYPWFEICIVDDHSPDESVAEIASEYARLHSNIKFARRAVNGHISAASNDALAMARNDFIVLVDHDDLIPDYSLFVVAHYINKYPKAKIFYSDEDKIDMFGFRSEPYFKSEFNRFLMYGHNMVSHLGVYERALLNEIGGFRMGFEGSQDYDLTLRALDRCGDDAIVHIPHVLYHWRTTPGSTSISADQKSYAVSAAQAAINSHFDRANTPLRSVAGFAPGVTAITATREYTAKVTIIIPTRDRVDLLKPCIDAIERAAGRFYDIVIVDNGSTDPDTIQYLAELGGGAGFSILPYPGPFNFSAINNAAAEIATGEILCFLNNDTEIVSAHWLDRARSLLAVADVGAVGARLLYEDGALQHFGIALGMADHRVAATPHAGLHASHPGYFGKARLIQEFSAVTAACLFVRKADFDRIGGYDPTLAVAYNDVDLCLRIREHKLKILCDPEIVIIHKESRTRGYDDQGERAARLDREAALMRDRWADTLDHDPYLSPNLALDRTDFALAYPPRAPLPWINEAS
jgi:glycosyltransferase involved in cell wall biosynthesis